MKKENINKFREEIENADEQSLDDMLTAIYAKKRNYSVWWGGANNKT